MADSHSKGEQQDATTDSFLHITSFKKSITYAIFTCLAFLLLVTYIITTNKSDFQNTALILSVVNIVLIVVPLVVLILSLVMAFSVEKNIAFYISQLEAAKKEVERAISNVNNLSSGIEISRQKSQEIQERNEKTIQRYAIELNERLEKAKKDCLKLEADILRLETKKKNVEGDL